VPETKLANIVEAAEVTDLSKKLNDLYHPPINVPERPIVARLIEIDPFTLFMYLLGWNSIYTIIDATNARAVASI
jgi:hypothetical protein